MGATYFASDLHLTAVEDPNFDRFNAFCQRVATDGLALYLLVDVFEAYIGDDDDAPLVAAVASTLRSLSDAGVRLAFAHGNRDFLAGGAFVERSGARLLGDLELIDLAGRKTALLHGDTLCTDDVEYQAVRRLLRDSTWQAQFLAQSLSARRAFAAQARAQSAAHTALSTATIMDVNPDAVAALFEKTQAHWIIHGHTHRPAVHGVDQNRRRIVLGDWPAQASWLRVAADGTGELQFAGRSLRV